MTATVITLSGEPGTGKTTIAKLLSEKIKLRLVTVGETFREIAKEYNMSLSDFSSFAKANPDIDSELDLRQLKQAQGGNVILDSRLSAWVVKNDNLNAFKVLLTADLDTRVRRIMGREGKKYDQVKHEILEREKSELERYKILYSANYLDKSLYDLIIDTSNLTPDEIVQKIIDGFSKFNSQN